MGRAKKITKDVVDIEMILPKFDNSGNPIKPDYYNKVLLSVSKLGGGITLIPNAYGCWKNEKGELQCEENFIIQTAIKKDNELGKKIKDLNDIEVKLRRELGQQSVIYIEDTDDKMIEIKGLEKEVSPKSIKKIRINILPEFVR